MDNIWNPLVSDADTSLLWIVLAGITLIVIFIWAVFHFRERNRFFGKIAGFTSGLGKGLASFRKIDNKLLFALYTCAIWLMYILMTFFILKAIPVFSESSFIDALFISAVGNLASVIPVPGGIGAYHYLVALTLSSLYGAQWDAGILFATLSHELHAILIIILGVISYFRLSLRKKNQL